MYYNSITMAMEVVQVRMPKRLIRDMDKLVKKGEYSSKSDVVRSGVRKILIDELLDNLVGIIPNTGDSVKEVRKIREKLSKEPFDLDEINSLIK